MKRRIKWICLIFWVSFIFFMSHQSGNVSSNTSFFFVKVILMYFPNNFLGKIEIMSFLIRKLAHILEYFILGILVLELVKEYPIKKSVLVSMLICICLSCIDEIHQIFIVGRNGTIVDVLIDTIGILTSILFITRIKINKKTY